MCTCFTHDNGGEGCKYHACIIIKKVTMCMSGLSMHVVGFNKCQKEKNHTSSNKNYVLTFIT
jgi:hypothetical protein